VEGLADARGEWQKWHSGATSGELAQLADPIESHHEAFEAAIEALKDGAARELKRREDRWRPMATNLAGWVELARKARTRAEDLPRIKAAEKWLKDASADIRNQRFAPIADKAMATCEHLRRQSNVTLGKIELVGEKTTRKVSLDVTVDGVAGAALGVMSQGELHSLALSLFLTRATLPESRGPEERWSRCTQRAWLPGDRCRWPRDSSRCRSLLGSGPGRATSLAAVP